MSPYLWQRHLRLTEAGRHDVSERDELTSSVQQFVDSGSFNRLFKELYCANQDPNILFTIIKRYIDAEQIASKGEIARYVYHSAWGQGEIRVAAEIALRWFT